MRGGEAERLRQCRETFALALAENVTIERAREALARRRWAELDARLAAKRCGTRIDSTSPAPGRDDARWMMRD